jgi:hypothetical protein
MHSPTVGASITVQPSAEVALPTLPTSEQILFDTCAPLLSLVKGGARQSQRSPHPRSVAWLPSTAVGGP